MRMSAAAALTASLVLAACGKDDEKSETDAAKPIDAAFLTSADLTAGASLETGSAAETLEELQEESFLYNNQPSGADDETDVCLDEILDGMIMRGSTSGVVKAGIDADLTACMAKSFAEDPDVTLERARFRFFGETVCDGVDLSQYEGKTFKEVVDANGEFELDCAAGGWLINIGVDYTVSAEAEGQSVVFSGVSVGYVGASTPGHCRATKVDGVSTYADDCISVDRTYEAESFVDGVRQPKGAETYAKYTAADVTSADNDTDVWPVSGVVTFTVNDWQGTVTFAAAAAPTYSMQGTFGAPATGTLTATASLAGGAPSASGSADRRVAAIASRLARTTRW